MPRPKPSLKEQLTARLLTLPEIVPAISPKYPDFLGFRHQGKEFAHFHGDNTLDLRYGKSRIRARKPELGEDPRVILRRSVSDWMEVEFRSAADVEFIVGLVKELMDER